MRRRGLCAFLSRLTEQPHRLLDPLVRSCGTLALLTHTRTRPTPFIEGEKPPINTTVINAIISLLSIKTSEQFHLGSAVNITNSRNEKPNEAGCGEPPPWHGA